MYKPSRWFLLSVAPILVLAYALAFANEYKSTHTPNANATLEIECLCVVPTETVLQCALNVLDLAADKPRHTWRQTVGARKDQPINLSAACYRKRDEDGFGAGRCCTTTASEASKYFAAKILE